MDSLKNRHYHFKKSGKATHQPIASPMRFSSKAEQKILKVFLLAQLNKLFSELFQINTQPIGNYFCMEPYEMDNKIIQLLIHGIVETEEYTLEGIAHYTRIPFDVIFDASCGNKNEFSITPWTRIVALYIQVKPEIAKILLEILFKKTEKNPLALLSLLNE